MLKIKVFDCEDERDLANELNNFIENISKQDKEVIDIKYSTSIAINDDEQIYCYSALVMYDEKIYKVYKPKRYGEELYQEYLEKQVKELNQEKKEWVKLLKMFKTQQQEFIKYLEENQFIPNITGEDFEEDYTITEVLQKYKEIIGVLDE